MIDKLRNKNARLSKEIYQLKSREDIEFKHRHFIKKEIYRLQNNQQRFKEQIRNFIEEAVYFKDIFLRIRQNIIYIRKAKERYILLNTNIKKDLYLDLAPI